MPLETRPDTSDSLGEQRTLQPTTLLGIRMTTTRKREAAALASARAALLCAGPEILSGEVGRS